MSTRDAIGITASRNAMTVAAGRAAFALLRNLRQRFDWMNHGDCVGGDELLASYWALAGGRLRAHDPDNSAMRAFVWSDERLPPLPYLQRNRAIVDTSACLVAVPDGPERERSGTWSTVRYARRLGRPVAVIMPDGSVVKER